MSSVKRDITVQTIIGMSINDKYTTLDNDRLKVSESDNHAWSKNKL